MSDAFSIRRATPDDAGTVLAFIQALADYEREPDAVEATEPILREQLASDRPPFECLLAEEATDDGPTARGFALFFTTYSTWRARPGIWLEDLFVPDAHRGRGIGELLLRSVARIAVERGCGRYEWCVLDWNESAAGFYRQLGARRLDEWEIFRIDGEALERLAADGS